MTDTVGPALRTPAFRLKNIGFKTAFLLFPIVIVYVLITDNPRGCGDTPLDFRFFPIASGSALLLALIWSTIDKQKYYYPRLQYALQIVVRFYIAYSMMLFGAVKVMDVQFSPNITYMDVRQVDLNSAALAWSFFGYSYSYEFFIGCGQIVAVLLLLFRKTATLGAILMVTILSNVVFVNFAYNICVKFWSCVYLVMTLYLLLEDAPRLINVLLLNKPAEKRVYPELFTGRMSKRVFSVLGILMGMFVTIYPTWFSYAGKIKYGIGNRNDLYGVWAVDSLHHSRDSSNVLLNTDSSGWKRILFDEDGTARAKSWKKRVGVFTYEIDTAKHTLHLQRTNPDSLLIVNTHYRIIKDTLYLNGKYGGDSLFIRLHLLRQYFLRKADQERKRGAAINF